MSDTSFTIIKQEISDVPLLSNKINEGTRLVFTGLVRDYNSAQQGITKIEYHCYEEMAIQEGEVILRVAIKKFGINRVACVHRIGLLKLQDTAIRLEIGSGHRLPAIQACEFIMDQIKLLVPIWKKEFFFENGIEKGVWM